MSLIRSAFGDSGEVRWQEQYKRGLVISPLPCLTPSLRLPDSTTPVIFLYKEFALHDKWYE
jgi:hypothetical protein